MVRIYLAHSAHERLGGKIIQQRLEKMGFEVYNPFYSIPREDIKRLDEWREVPWTVQDGGISKWIVHTDLAAIRKSDIIVCIYPDNKKRTVGIPCEMMYAWLNHIPVFSWTPEDMSGHPWIVYMSKEVFTNKEHLLKFLKGYPRISTGHIHTS